VGQEEIVKQVRWRTASRAALALLWVLPSATLAAAQADLLWWAGACGPRVRKFFLVHGEPAQSAELARQLQRQGRTAVAPTAGQAFDLD